MSRHAASSSGGCCANAGLRAVAPRKGRHVPAGRPTLPRQIPGGWLAFQNRHERRRVLPVPDEWEDTSDPELQALLAHSKLSSRPRRPAV